MTWNANKPADNESPSLGPQQIRNNWSRIQAMISSDHNFTTGVSADQGWHKIINAVNQTGDLGDNSPAPVAGRGQLYTKTVTTTGLSSTAGAGEHLMYQRGTGGTALQEASLTACPIRASVNFLGKTSAGDCMINWGYNVSSVKRLANTGEYKIEFATNMPSIYYVPTVNAGMISSSNKIRAQFGPGVYGDVFKVNEFLFLFNRRDNSSGRDPDFATVTIMGG